MTCTYSIKPAAPLPCTANYPMNAVVNFFAPGWQTVNICRGGTVTFSQPATVTNAPTTIIYNPVTYDAPTDFSPDIIGAAPTQKMLVFAQGEDKVFDGTTAATLSPLLMGNPVGVTLLAGSGSTANFAPPAAACSSS